MADAYEAMTSERVYKAAMPTEDAQRELRDQAGRQFDPLVVEAFLDALAEDERLGAVALVAD